MDKWKHVALHSASTPRGRRIQRRCPQEEVWLGKSAARAQEDPGSCFATGGRCNMARCYSTARRGTAAPRSADRGQS
eukprot:g14730.t1